MHSYLLDNVYFFSNEERGREVFEIKDFINKIGVMTIYSAN